MQSLGSRRSGDIAAAASIRTRRATSIGHDMNHDGWRLPGQSEGMRKLSAKPLPRYPLLRGRSPDRQKGSGTQHQCSADAVTRPKPCVCNRAAALTASQPQASRMTPSTSSRSAENRKLRSMEASGLMNCGTAPRRTSPRRGGARCDESWRNSANRRTGPCGYRIRSRDFETMRRSPIQRGRPHRATSPLERLGRRCDHGGNPEGGCRHLECIRRQIACNRPPALLQSCRALLAMMRSWLVSGGVAKKTPRPPSREDRFDGHHPPTTDRRPLPIRNERSERDYRRCGVSASRNR